MCGIAKIVLAFEESNQYKCLKVNMIIPEIFKKHNYCLAHLEGSSVLVLLFWQN